MKKITALIFTMMISFAVFTPLSLHAKTKISAPTKVRVRSSESKKLKVTWNKVKKKQTDIKSMNIKRVVRSLKRQQM